MHHNAYMLSTCKKWLATTMMIMLNDKVAMELNQREQVIMSGMVSCRHITTQL